MKRDQNPHSKKVYRVHTCIRQFLKRHALSVYQVVGTNVCMQQFQSLTFLTKDGFLSFISGYWHQVRSYGSKNMAVSVLFSRLTEFDPIGCESAKLEYTPLSDVNMVWTYPGHGPQTMGNLDPFEMKYVLHKLFNTRGYRANNYNN